MLGRASRSDRPATSGGAPDPHDAPRWRSPPRRRAGRSARPAAGAWATEVPAGRATGARGASPDRAGRMQGDAGRPNRSRRGLRRRADRRSMSGTCPPPREPGRRRAARRGRGRALRRGAAPPRRGGRWTRIAEPRGGPAGRDARSGELARPAAGERGAAGRPARRGWRGHDLRQPDRGRPLRARDPAHAVGRAPAAPPPRRPTRQDGPTGGDGGRVDVPSPAPSDPASGPVEYRLEAFATGPVAAPTYADHERLLDVLGVVSPGIGRGPAGGDAVVVGGARCRGRRPAAVRRWRSAGDRRRRGAVNTRPTG